MPACPRPGAGIPELTVPVARAATGAGTTAMRGRDRPGGPRADGDLAGRHPRDGRPGAVTGPAGRGGRAAVPAGPA